MLNPSVPLAVTPKHGTRALTDDGKRVVAFAQGLPTAADGSKRQCTAVAKSFVNNPDFALEITDFMTKPEFDRVNGGNGPPSYNNKTGQYFDHEGAAAEVICTDQSLLVAKKK